MASTSLTEGIRSSVNEADPLRQTAAVLSLCCSRRTRDIPPFSRGTLEQEHGAGPYRGPKIPEWSKVSYQRFLLDALELIHTTFGGGDWTSIITLKILRTTVQNRFVHSQYKHNLLLITNFRWVLIVVFFLLVDSKCRRLGKLVCSIVVGGIPMKMEQCSETSAHKIQTPGNHPKERKKT